MTLCRRNTSLVACPEHSPPGMLLGRFRSLSAQRVGTSQEILHAHAVQELCDVIEYANRFHHDPNAAYPRIPPTRPQNKLGRFVKPCR
jgi:hypothetical protein